jgi:hypothetical protein
MKMKGYRINPIKPRTASNGVSSKVGLLEANLPSQPISRAIRIGDCLIVAKKTWRRAVEQLLDCGHSYGLAIPGAVINRIEQGDEGLALLSFRSKSVIIIR